MISMEQAQRLADAIRVDLGLKPDTSGSADPKHAARELEALRIELNIDDLMYAAYRLAISTAAYLDARIIELQREHRIDEQPLTLAGATHQGMIRLAESLKAEAAAARAEDRAELDARAKAADKKADDAGRAAKTAREARDAAIERRRAALAPVETRLASINTMFPRLFGVCDLPDSIPPITKPRDDFEAALMAVA